MLSHANLMHNSEVIKHAFEHTRSSSGVFWLPSYHDMGLVGGILQPLYVGRPNILLSPAAFSRSRSAGSRPSLAIAGRPAGARILPSTSASRRSRPSSGPCWT
jgi:hypothetical protein